MVKRSIPELAVRGGADSDCDTSATESCTESKVEEVTVHRTDPKDWKQIKEGQTGRTIYPIPYAPCPEDAEFLQDDNRDGNDFGVKITEEEVEAMKDSNGNIMFEKVAEHLLLKFDEGDYFEYLAARIRNYMLHLIRTTNYKPLYYKPTEVKCILSDYAARMFGVHHARMFRGHPNVPDTYDTREPLNEILSATESLPRDAMQDLHRCLHFDNDWDGEDDGIEWTEVYLDDKKVSPETAKHRAKFAVIEDAHNERWKLLITFGRRLTFDETCCAGLYKAGITIGPEPKPIRTDATMHSMCVTDGPLETYKLHVRTYVRWREG